MTARHDLDRLLTAWLTDEAGPIGQPSYVAETLDLVERTEQRRVWPWSGRAIPRRWTRIDIPTRVWAVVVVMLLALAIVIAALIGAFRSPPLPSGPGRIVVTLLDGPLAVVNPDGGHDELPGAAGFPTMASVSPDGTRVAWWTWVTETSPDGVDTTTVPLTVADLDGANQVQVLDGVVPPIHGVEGRPQWSPDGRSIVFGSAGTIYRVDIDGGEVTALGGAGPDVHRSAPTWSPDGAWIAFHAAARSDEPLSRPIGPIHVIRVDGTEETVVSGDPQAWSGNFGPTWSADSRRLAFVIPRTVTNPQFGESAVPGGIAIATLEASGWTTASIEGIAGIGDQVMLDWAPRGFRLAYMRDGEPMLNGVVPSVLMLIEPGGTLRQVTTEPLAQGFCWSPDASRIAVMILDRGLVALDADTGDVVADFGIANLNVGDACVWSAWAGEPR